MKRWIPLLLALVMVLTMVPAGAEEAANGPFTPFEEEYVMTSVFGYGTYDNNTTTPGTTPENNLSNDMLKKHLNIKVDWLWTVPSEQYDQRLQLSLSSGGIPDVLNVGTEVMFRNLLESGQLIDIAADFEAFVSDELRAQHAYTDNKMIKEVTDSEGRMYAFPNGEDVLMQSIACYYRKDWADKLNIAEPKSVYDVGEMAIAFATQDPDGDGEADTYGIAANSDPINSLSLNGMFWSFGSYPNRYILNADGEVVPGTISDETLEALKYMADLYTKGAINPEFATLTGALVDEALIASELGIYYALWWSPNYPLNINYQQDFEAEWAAVPLLGPDGEMANNLNTERMSSSFRVAFNTGKERLGEALVKTINLGYDINYVSNKARQKEVYPEIYRPTSDEPEYDPEFTVAYQWSWWPVYVVPPSQYVNMFYELNTVFETGDTSLLRNNEYEGNYVAWQYLFGGEADRTNELYGAYWGNWFSRANVDGGMGTMIKHREAGKIIENVYYGQSTPTQIERQTDIDTMVKEYFCRFIMGDVGEDSWAGFVDNYNSMGGAQILEEVRAQYAELH